MDKKQEIKLSKFLSLLLRHNPGIIGLQLDENGWANIDELIEKCATKGHKFDLEDLKQVVENCNKQRYLFNNETTKIRANQGHSINVDLELAEQKPPDFLYHGTASRFLESILSLGLDKKNRQYVHLSSDIETAIKVGQRHGKVVILKIDSKKMYNNACKFYISKNGVWLTRSVHPKYITIENEK